MLKSCGWMGGVVAHKNLVAAQMPNYPFPVDLTGTGTGTWPGACQFAFDVCFFCFLINPTH